MNSEPVYVKEREVYCDGKGVIEEGHPLVFLYIKEKANKVSCPYCSKNFEVLSSV